MNKIDSSLCVLHENHELKNINSQNEVKSIAFDISYTPYISSQSDTEREYAALKNKARVVLVTSVAVGIVVSLGLLIGKHL